MAATPRHVVFGTGAIGLATLEALRRRGERVRLVNRSGTAPVPDDVEILRGDTSDPAFATAAAQGAQVVYQTLNPPYHQWVELSPPCRPACWPPPKPVGPGWSAWRTSTCTAAPTDSP
jgi:nucleoside-diphosphate-sugar epimerase